MKRGACAPFFVCGKLYCQFGYKHQWTLRETRTNIHVTGLVCGSIYFTIFGMSFEWELAPIVIGWLGYGITGFFVWEGAFKRNAGLFNHHEDGEQQ
jgi:hypothetical protein